MNLCFVSICEWDHTELISKIGSKHLNRTNPFRNGFVRLDGFSLDLYENVDDRNEKDIPFISQPTPLSHSFGRLPREWRPNDRSRSFNMGFYGYCGPDLKFPCGSFVGFVFSILNCFISSTSVSNGYTHPIKPTITLWKCRNYGATAKPGRWCGLPAWYRSRINWTRNQSGKKKIAKYQPNFSSMSLKVFPIITKGKRRKMRNAGNYSHNP